MSVCYLVSLIKGQLCHNCCQGKVSKGTALKTIVFKEFFMNLLAFDTGYSQKKKNEIFDFWSYLTFFLKTRHILDNCTSQGFPLEE